MQFTTALIASILALGVAASPIAEAEYRAVWMQPPVEDSNAILETTCCMGAMTCFQWSTKVRTCSAPAEASHDNAGPACGPGTPDYCSDEGYAVRIVEVQE